LPKSHRKNRQSPHPIHQRTNDCHETRLRQVPKAPRKQSAHHRGPELFSASRQRTTASPPRSNTPKKQSTVYALPHWPFHTCTVTLSFPTPPSGAKPPPRCWYTQDPNARPRAPSSRQLKITPTLTLVEGPPHHDCLGLHAHAQPPVLPQEDRPRSRGMRWRINGPN
jgi:hypothetical protein